ncbi:MAG: glycosyltransferase family 2 protein [Methylotenera sp.]|nr:glycosyltransferase family 2 protein [Methylotenera sp.]
MLLKKIEPSDMCAIIVTYHPDSLFYERVLAISSQVGNVFIVDNGSNRDAEKMLRNINQSPSINIIFNNENLGIAKALNIGISLAEKNGYQFAILFDQDSKPNKDLAANLCKIYSAHPNTEKIALIGANYDNVLKNAEKKPSHQLNAKCEWHEVKRVITSGSLLSFTAYQKIGPFREDFFIDLVDIEYCMRARKLGYSILRSNRVLMLHSIGYPSKHLLFGKTIWATNHTAIRRYYYARNYVAIQREYGNYILGWWAIKSLKKCIRQSFIIILFEQHKLDNLAAIAKGWWHGMNNKMGQYSL